MSLKLNFELMADYNQWMNNSIYSAARNIGASELAKDRGAYFGSIFGTLNHILVGDTIWLQRFSGHLSSLKALDYVRGLPRPKTLRAILHTDFDELIFAREKMDVVISDFTRELSNEMLSSTLSYRNTTGEVFVKNYGFLIQHMFNHQTHHRGQVTALLSQAGVDVGVTDLLVTIPNQGKKG